MDETPDWAKAPVVAKSTADKEVEILTDLKEYFELEDVGKELVGTAVVQTLFDLLSAIYNLRGWNGDIDRVDYTTVLTETYSKSFLLGFIITAIGHFKARAKNKQKKQIIPYLHPCVFEEGALKYVPRGSSTLVSFVMGRADRGASRALHWVPLLRAGPCLKNTWRASRETEEERRSLVPAPYEGRRST